MKGLVAFGVVFLLLICGILAQTPSQVRGPTMHAQVVPAMLIHRVDPIYPVQAKKAGVQGTVRLEVMIRPDGKVQGMTVLSGHPALAKAAMKAVSKWRYKPALLNGEPVGVPTEVTLSFTLAGN